MLRDCLHTVFAGLDRLQAEIFVVDNASSDDSLAMLAAEFPTVIAIANAVFNATGIRIRRYPLVAERVKKALA